MTRRDPADEIIGRYRDALDRGEAVDPEQIVRLHPEIADTLRRRFAALRLLDRAYASASSGEPAAPAATVRPGRTMGPYRLRAELGSGGMGTVFLATTERATDSLPAGTDVALKVVHPHLAARPGFVERFHREGAAGRRVRHPHVVPTYDMGDVEVDGATTLYMTMAYVEGQTLRELLLDLGRVPEALVREVMRQVADGLDAIHAAGIVHRDLKPENVLITADHEVRIGDLGIARLREASEQDTGAVRFAGSVFYAAPEQFRGEVVGPPADLYALGVLAYELLRGSNPFRHEVSMAVMRAHLEHRPPPLDANDEVSPFLAAVVAALLEKDPAKRLRSAAQLRDLLTEGETSAWWARRRREGAARRRARPRIPVRRETRLHGRAEALAVLEAAWAEALAGRGNAVLVLGEEGIGKTRLADAFAERLADGDAAVLYGSYAPEYEVGGLAQAVLGHFAGEDLETALARYLPATPSLVPGLAATIRSRGDTDEPAPLAVEVVQTVVADLLGALAAERPLLWIVDDVHHASVGSRRILLAMARALEGQRILLVANASPELDPETTSALGRLARLRRIELGRLPPHEVVALVRDALRSESLAERLGVKIANRSDGVPFFVLETIRSLEDEGFLARAPDGTFTLSRVVEDLEVPSVVRDLVRSRLADLSKEERAILDVGATEGFTFDADLVARVLGRKRIAVLQDLAEIERRLGLVRAQGRRFRFDHQQIRDVVYEDLPGALRADHHALLARARMDQEDVDPAQPRTTGAVAAFLALHLLRGVRPADAAPFLRPALEHLRATYRHEAALEVASAALRTEGLLRGPERSRVLADAAAGYEALGRWVREQAALEEAVALADETGDAAARTDLHTRLGLLHARRARWAEARASYGRALEIARARGECGAEGRAEAGLAELDGVRGAYEEAERRYERASALARDAGDPRGVWTAVMGLGELARRRGLLAAAEARFRLALDGAVREGGEEDVARSCTALGATLETLGRREEALALHQRALDAACRAGDRACEAHALGSLGNLHAHAAAFDEARRCHERALDIACETGDRRAEAAGLDGLGRVHLHLGETVRARQRFDACRAIGREIGDRGVQMWAAVRLGATALQSDDPASALDRAREGLVLARESGDRPAEGAAHACAGEALAGLGRVGEARRHLDLALEILGEMGDRAGEAAAACARADLDLLGGALASARAGLDRALGLAAEVGDPRTQTRAHELTGRLLLEVGNAEVARRHLEHAVDLAAETGGRRSEAQALLDLARLEAQADRPLEARRHARRARTLGRDASSPGLATVALCRLASLPGGEAEGARRAVAEQGGRMPVSQRLEALHLLWRATGEREPLTEAGRAIEALCAAMPEDARAALDALALVRDVREALA